jgi:hypothetical protein
MLRLASHPHFSSDPYKPALREAFSSSDDKWQTIRRAPLLSDRLQLASALPDPSHRFPEFLVGDVQVPLRLLDVGVPEHQLDGADVDSVGQEPTSALVTQVVPVQIDLPELLTVHASAGVLSSRG